MRIAVLGGGISGISSAKVALRFGHEVIIIEKEGKIGGLMARIANCRVGFQTFFEEIRNSPKLKVLTGKRVLSCERRNGLFLLDLDDGERVEVDRVVLATGLISCEPDTKGRRILSSLEYDSLIDQRNEALPNDLKKIAFILCHGSRSRDYPLCSSVCCSYTLRQIKWTLLRTHPEITVFYNDLRLFGQEFFLLKALKDSNVRFLRTNSKSMEEDEEGVKVRYFSGGKLFEEKFNYLVTVNALRPNPELGHLSRIFGFSLNEHGFVKEASPLQTDVDGVFACGGSLEPMNIKDSILTGFAAGYLASGGKGITGGKMVFRKDPPGFDLPDSGESFAFYLGVDDTYSSMFYEYFSLVFVELALKLVERKKQVYVVTRNSVFPSYEELIYEKARREGVVFIHLEEDERVSFDKGSLRIEGGKKIEIKVDHLILMEDFCRYFREFEVLGFSRSEPQLRWSPTKWDRNRYHVGFLRYPRSRRWETREYYAACAEALLDSEARKVPEVLEESCSGCGFCKNACLANAIETKRRDRTLSLFGLHPTTFDPIAKIDPNLCIGCGLCASICPSHAIKFDFTRTSTDRQSAQENR